MKQGEILMSSRSERYIAKAEQCRQIADAAHNSGVKRLYEVLASQWLRLAEQAEETGAIESSPLLACQPAGAQKASADPMPPQEPHLIPPKTSAINSSRRDMLDNLEREIERFKNSVQPPSLAKKSPAPSGAQG
jgi:hypothetical protein